MNKSTKLKIKQEVNNYVQFVSNLIKKLRTEGKLTTIDELYQKMIVTSGFKYTSTGVGGYGMQGKEIIKKIWNPAEILVLSKTIEESKDCKKFISTIKKYSKIDLNEFSQLINLNGRIISRILNNKDVEKNILEPLYNDLIDKTNEATAIVDLIGITLESKKIKLTKEIELRQVFKKDLEYKIPAFPAYIKSPNLDRPQSILTITKQLKKHQTVELQYEVERIIFALQLTKLGSIKYLKYSMRSKTLLGFFSGILSQINSLSSNLLAHINKKEEKEFIETFQKIYHELKINNRKIKDKDYLNTAIEFFKESTIEQGQPPKKIAQAIMSLEALFSDSSQELKFKLSTRISKLIGLINNQPKETINIIKLAYDVRSTYAHGSEIGEKLTKKINNTAGSIEELRKQIAEILRMSILVMLQTKKTKKQLLELIDNSLITKDNYLEKELKNISV